MGIFARFAQIFTALLVTVGLIAVAPAPSEASTTYVTLAASRTERLLSETSTLTTKYYKSGKLQKSGTLYLQYKSGTKWVNARTLKIPSTGTVKTVVQASVNRTYRIATSKNATVSPSVKVNLKTSYTISPSATSVDKGATVKFTARFYSKGKPVTGKVRLQYYRNGVWNNLRTTTLKNGVASASHTPASTLKWRFAHATNGSKTSSVTVKLKPVLALSLSPSSIDLGGSSKISVSLTRDGKAVAKEALTIQNATGSGWKTFKSLTVTSGKATLTVKPEVTTKYRAVTSDGLVTPTKLVTVKAADLPSNWVSTNVGLNLRSGPSTSYASILPKLEYGEKVSLLPEDSVVSGGFNWVNIRTSDGRTGWVADMYLTDKDPSSTGGGLSTSTFTLNGSGFGHGIGMSQYGAYQMAREGKTANQILGYYYTGTSVSGQAIPSGLQNIKIQVLGPETFGFNSSYGDAYTTRTLSFADAGSATGSTWRLRTGSNSSVTIPTASGSTSNIPLTHKLRVTKSGTSVKAEILDGSNKVVATHTDSVVRVHLSGTTYYRPGEANAVVTIPGANGTYNNGRLEISVLSDVLNITNQLKLNSEYLYGIAEMPSSWGSSGGASLEAQAIAARTYALRTARTSATTIAKCNCNLVDDIRHQNFTGWRKQGEGTNQSFGKLWSAAVDKTVNSSTNGDVVKYDGSYIATYYYSASGGATANSEDVWSSKLAYLRSVDDPYSLTAPGNSNKSWTYTISQSKARGIFTQLDDVKSLEITQKYEGGLVKTVTARASDGTTQSLTKKADQWRSTFGTKAAWINSITAN